MWASSHHLEYCELNLNQLGLGDYVHLRRRLRQVRHPALDLFCRDAAGVSVSSAISITSIELQNGVDGGRLVCYVQTEERTTADVHPR